MAEHSNKKYSPSDFKIEKAKTENKEEYRDFLAKHFCTREQLTVGCHIPIEEGTDYFASLLDCCIDGGASVVAIHVPTNKLAGVSFTKILTKDNNITFPLSETLKYGKGIQNLSKIVTEMEEKVDIFQDPKIEKVLEIAMTAADPEFAGNKITYKMTEEIERLAKEVGCQMITAQSTNKITQHIRSKMGYEPILKMDYEDIVIDGEKAMDLNVLNGTVLAVVFRKYIS